MYAKHIQQHLGRMALAKKIEVQFCPGVAVQVRREKVCCSSRWKSCPGKGCPGRVAIPKGDMGSV